MKLIRVPLRISLCGGGSDIPSHYETHGGEVVCFTINKYIYLTIKDASLLFPRKYRLVYSQVEECNHSSDIQHPIIKKLIEDYDISGLDLDVMSDIPAGTGMGSSSSFTVGLHKAFSDFLWDKSHYAEAACKTEIYDLKEPIGKQDQYAASFGGLNHFQFIKNKVIVNPIELAEHTKTELLNSLHLIYVGGSRKAGHQLQRQNISSKTKIVKKMAKTAQTAALALKTGYINKLGPLIKQNWELKKQLSTKISTKHIDAIITKALKSGATGGKLLGAGGAGFILLFCPLKNRSQMLSGLRPFNLTYVFFEFDEQGCKVLYQD